MGVFFEEQRVLHSSVTGVHGAFEDDNVLRLPHFQYWHTGDWAFRIVLRGRVNGIVSANYQHGIGIGIGEVVVDLIHLQHDVIRDFRFRQQHVHVARQTPGNRVNTKAHLNATGTQALGDFRNRILSLRDRHAIARGDDHRMGVFQHLSGIFGGDLAMFTHLFVTVGRLPV